MCDIEIAAFQTLKLIFAKNKNNNIFPAKKMYVTKHKKLREKKFLVFFLRGNDFLKNIYP